MSLQSIKYIPLSRYEKDIVKYIKENFLKNKKSYIDKEMSYFLDNLEIPIYKFTSSIGYPPNSVYSHISIKFYNDVTIANKVKNKEERIVMVISFNPPLQPNIIEPIMQEAKGKWTKEVHQFFGKQKVKNIEIVEYGF
jgi:hypothetical protein